MTIHPSQAPADGLRPSPGAAGALVALGALNALWSLFLWGELLLSRAGGTPFCPLGGGTQCGALWDGAFASAIHRLTGVPVAGWGVVWGLAAAALPLALLVRQAEGGHRPELVSAVRVIAAGGVASVLVFLVVSAASRSFCVTCFVSYVLVAGYAGIALITWQPLGLPRPDRGIGLAVGACAAAFLALLYPGLATPRGAMQAGREAVAAQGARAGDPSRDAQLREFVGSLSPQMKQTLADALGLFRRGAVFPTGTPRSLYGSAHAPLRITEFTDILCEHCADLHRTLVEIEGYVPAGTFAVEPRQFPLDGECNPAVQQRANPVRCAAAKAQICLEGQEKAREASGKLFEKQKDLKVADVSSILEPYVPRQALEQCMASPDTQRKLESDVELAMKYDLEGTPLVLLNGRKAVSFPPFLYAMVLTGGNPDHPAFAALPPANPNAHMH